MRFEFQARILRDAGFSLEVNETCETSALGLVGPSGSGKSTLLHAIAGIEPGATVRIDDFDLSNLAIEKRRVGYVTQDPLLFPHMTVRKNLLFGPRAGSPEEVAAALGIDTLLDRMPRNLSGGEKRRVALARAILSQPKVLLLDEPFSGLDELRRREAISLIHHIRTRFKIPMILVSHLADELIGLTDWMIRLEKGRVIQRGESLSVLRAREIQIDNYFTGKVVEKNRVQVGPLNLSVVLPENVSGDLRFSCYAQDILLAKSPPSEISARNIFQTKIVKTTRLENTVLIEIEPSNLRVIVTHEAATILGLETGKTLFAIIKATSIAFLGRA